MCTYQTLVHNKDGYIIRCPDCKRLQLAFGTTMTTVDVEEYAQLRAQVDMECRYGAHCTNPGLKETVIPIDAHSMLCLNHTELLHLQLLLEGAAALLETYCILEEVE